MLPGGRYLVFLAPSPQGDGVSVPVGGSQGIFRVSSDGSPVPLAPGAPTSPDFAGRSIREVEVLLSS